MSSAPHSAELLEKFEPLVDSAKEALSEARQNFSLRPNTPLVSSRATLMADLGARLAATKQRLSQLQVRLHQNRPWIDCALTRFAGP